MDNCLPILVISDCKERRKERGRDGRKQAGGQAKREDSRKSHRFTQETSGRTGSENRSQGPGSLIPESVLVLCH